MPDFDSLEASGDMLSHEPPVTLGGLVLGTEEADRSRLLEEGGILQGIPRGQRSPLNYRSYGDQEILFPL